MSVFYKDSDAVLDYTIDWSEWLDTDLITDSVWTVPTGITVDSEDQAGTSTVIWLSGGTTGRSYALTNRITTAAGRIQDRTILIKVTQH
jgi:hypothetical protein